MPEIEQKICQNCQHLERPNLHYDTCLGFGHYSDRYEILKAELNGLLNWLEHNNTEETNKEKVNAFLKHTERFY